MTSLTVSINSTSYKRSENRDEGLLPTTGQAVSINSTSYKRSVTQDQFRGNIGKLFPLIPLSIKEAI